MTADVGLVTSVGIAFVGVFGLLIGSFINVVVYRVPAGVSIVTPPSACPDCGSPIRAHDNVPVISWLLLAGRCRDCRKPISARYPLVEAAVGALFAVVAIWRWPSIADAQDTAALVSSVLVVAAFLYLAAISVVLGLIDIDTHTLPNAIVLPAYVVGAVLLVAAALIGSDIGALGLAAIGGSSAFLLYLVIAIIAPGGMGFGDVKLAGVIGIFLGYLGWAPLVVGVFAAFILGGVFGLVLTVSGRGGRRRGIPFGPWMLAGAWMGAFFGPAIAGAYLSLFGLA